MNKFDLEERLIRFSVSIIKLSDNLKKTKAANHLSGQLIRSGTSVALNYGEAQGSESKKDFIHKIKVILKELRETYVCLKIILRAELFNNIQELENAINENNELISIL